MTIQPFTQPSAVTVSEEGGAHPAPHQVKNKKRSIDAEMSQDVEMLAVDRSDDDREDWKRAKIGRHAVKKESSLKKMVNMGDEEYDEIVFKTNHGDVCRLLNVDEGSEEESWKVLEGFYSSDGKSYSFCRQRSLSAAALFIVGYVQKRNLGIGLNQLLNVESKSVPEFAQELEAIALHVSFSSMVSQGISLIEDSFNEVEKLFASFSDAFKNAFRYDPNAFVAEPVALYNPSDDIPKFKNHLFYISWLIVLNVKRLPCFDVVQVVSWVKQSSLSTEEVNVNPALVAALKGLCLCFNPQDVQFQASLIVLKQQHDLYLHAHITEYDGTLLLASMEVHTPKKHGFTDQDRSPATRNLNPEFDRASVYHSMPSTPLTAKCLVSSRPPIGPNSITDFKACQERLLALASKDCVNIQSFFNACEINPSSLIEHLISNILTKQTMFDHVIVKGLFYRFLESMLVAEEMRLETKKFDVWLHDERFHSSLLVCAMEIVRFVYQIDLTFDKVLEDTGVAVFEFLIIIENVIKHETSLPWLIIKRLKEIEERILETGIFQEREPLYSLLAQGDVARKALNVLSGTTPSIYGEALEMKKPSSTCTKISFQEFFYRKFYRLLHTRLVSLTSKLSLPTNVVSRIWNLLVVTVEKETELSLFYKRHSDQILFCAIYAVCKSLSCERTFKQIITAYRVQPNFDENIYKSVYVDDENHLDIIKFYNCVFVNMMKDSIYALKSEDENFPMPTQRTMDSPRRISLLHHIYVSPLKNSVSNVSHPRLKMVMNQAGWSPRKMATATPRSKDLFNTEEMDLIKTKTARKLDF